MLGEDVRSLRSKLKIEKSSECGMSTSFGEFLGIDRELIEFEWNIFPGFTSLHIL